LIFKASQKALCCILFTTTLSLAHLVGCSAPAAGVLPVVKVGLIAPFEGPQRAAAYECLFSVKLAIKEYNESSRDVGPLVELVALNDSLQPVDAAKRRALQQMIIDPVVLGVIGPWMEETDEYMEPGNTGCRPKDLPLLVPQATDVSSISQTRWAYNATKTLLLAIRGAHLESDLSRQNVERKLRTSK